MNQILLSSNNMDWETPQDFFDKLDEEFNFTLDPCCTLSTAKCKGCITKEGLFDRDNKILMQKGNGLNLPWHSFSDSIFINPPYGREIGQWIKKAYEESLKGCVCVCLIPARTDTAYWHDYCMKGEIRFIRGRLKFKGKNKQGEWVNNSATFPSSIIIFDGRSK